MYGYVIVIIIYYIVTIQNHQNYLPAEICQIFSLCGAASGDKWRWLLRLAKWLSVGDVVGGAGRAVSGMRWDMAANALGACWMRVT